MIGFLARRGPTGTDARVRLGLRRRAGRRERVAFIDRPPRSGFMDTDLECLRAEFDVTVVTYPGSTTGGYLLRCVAAALQCEAVYIFFASEHSLAPAAVFRLLGRRVVLVQGGYDYADVPERRYGLIARGHGWLPRTIGALCSVSLAISDQSRWEFIRAVPRSARRTHLAPLPVPVERWRHPGVARRADRVVTFAYVDEESFDRKGIDRFLAAAVQDPTREYVLGGRVDPTMVDRIESTLPGNVVLAGYLDHDALRRLLWSSAVYAQLSWHETFGMAMAEAMACGCIPVIGDSPALAEVAGSWAVRAGDGSGGAADDVSAIDRAIAAATAVEPGRIRADIASRFDLERRRDDLARAVRGTIDRSAVR